MRRNDDTPFGCYIIFFVIIFIVFAVSNCNDEKRDTEKQKEAEKQKQIQNAYTNKFDFKLENLSKEIENFNLQKIEKATPKKPIIIFQKREINNQNHYFFYYELNKKLENELVSFNYNQINTIVIVSDTLINIGNYSRTNKIGFRNNIIITYIDNKTKKAVFKDVIVGEDPPQEIKYYEKDESKEVYGKRPTESEVFQRIKNHLK